MISCVYCYVTRAATNAACFIVNGNSVCTELTHLDAAEFPTLSEGIRFLREAAE